MSWLQPQPYDYRLFDRLNRCSAFGRLCLILAPALRIEPRLLRNARQRYLPRSDASLENRLWFSRVVEIRSSCSVNLRPGLARLLVDELAGGERLERICEFITEQTRDWDELDRLEQSLRWAVRDNNQARVGELLRDLLRRIGASTEARSRADLARWIKGALPPLQAATEAHRESGWLAQFAGAALGDTGIVLRGHGTPREPMPGWLATLLPARGGLTLGLCLVRSDERLILECLAPEPGLPRLELFTPAPAPVHIECENRAQGSPGWVSLFVGCRIPIDRACRALILQTLDGRRFRVATVESSEAISSGYSSPRKVALVCASGDERQAYSIADLLKRQGVSVRVEQLAASTQQTPAPVAAADPEEQLVGLWSRHAASAIQNDPERVRNVFPPAASGAAYRLIVGLDKTPLPEGLGTGGTQPARLDFSKAPADWDMEEAQALLSALSSESTGALQVLRADNTVEEFRSARLVDDIVEVLSTAHHRPHVVADPGRQALGRALAQQIKAKLRRRYPRGGVVDSVEIGDDVERALIQAGEHEAARAYAERVLRGPRGGLGKDSVQAADENEQARPADTTAGTDIYLSHAHVDQSVARDLARRLADAGWRVLLPSDLLMEVDSEWSDKQRLRKIEQRIKDARCILVLWSSAAGKSDWVRAEATWAVQWDTYFPALLDDFASIPPGFGQYQCADLRGWPRKKGAEAAFERFLKELKDFIAADARKESSASGEVPTPEVLTDRLVAELDDPLTPPTRRMEIGDRLSQLGDPRPGVGLDEQGLPDIDWVHIPAGPFLYGNRKESRELPDFFIARYPVTNAQYQAFIDVGGYRDERWWQDLDHRFESPEASPWPAPNRPKTNVSWSESIAYCRWLSTRLGFELRLSTELEWEKAARGTDGREYPWGDAYREGYANVNEREPKAGPHYLAQSSAVGIYRHGASPYGVLDLSGNVWEWCLNEYDKSANSGLSGNRSRVLRGGAWNSYPGNCRAANRNHGRPDYRSDRFGFRVCRGSPIDQQDAGAPGR